jgi:hypothetical protein
VITDFSGQVGVITSIVDSAAFATAGGIDAALFFECSQGCRTLLL